ncbi:MAG: hypothetical protein RLZZ403_831 [Pseudomonadota bacterium]|jgi:hypothetical protein
MDPIFRWIESTEISVWLGESESVFVFPAILVVHTLGMAMLAGISAVTDLRMLGFARQIPPERLDRYWPLFLAGLALILVSGILLLIGYPTKALTNPVFYLKMVCVGVGIWIALQLRKALGLQTTPRIRRLAVLSLVVWTLSITLGRLLQYTYTRLYVDMAGT